MEVLLGFMGTKAVAAIIGVMALLGAKDKDVEFTKTRVILAADTLTINTKLKNSFPKGLKDIILSGTPVNMRFTFQNKEANSTMEVIHNVKYDIVTKSFTLTLSEIDKSFTVKTMKEVENIMNTLEDIKIIYPVKGAVIILKAIMDPVNIEAIGGKEFQLMAFWDYQVPVSKIVAKK